ncbi:uncharacterized protein BDR25DRAFT_307624 [Lindgomyces ingoldianus]|uniref:Uncharacterized protein n=1 Tax=Lindgomyces ingoldianus TaxID=673940 RepID=A0ACB6QB72_9PLEO|nr:uncharacterized protein BDR25DRAFT_307624 [Lindgomyces ingoldianus]KAF2463750.1 hypothetical protein BDR25DRAFT_307624 [Lindgomyces ingoldianus]
MDIGSAQGIASTNEQSSTSGSLSYICEAPPDAEEPTDNAEYPKEMDVDSATPASKSSSKKKIHRSKINRRRKPRNQITFPQTRGKGALKPFSESRTRVQKRR